MKTIFVSAVLVTLYVALGWGQMDKPIMITAPYKINPYIRDNCLYNEMGMIPKWRNCGGMGKTLSMRHEKCITGGEPPCNLPADGTGRAELVFIPCRTTTGMGVYTRIFANGERKTYETHLPNVTVIAGQEYAMTLSGGATAELLGMHFTSQLDIFRLSDKVSEACSEQDHFVTPAESKGATTAAPRVSRSYRVFF